MLTLLELVWLGHEYTHDYVDTATACVNAGVCLEDGNLYSFANVFDHIGDAVKAVRYSYIESCDCHVMSHVMSYSLPKW